MAGWFAKAKETLVRRESVEPQPFDVRCGCGYRLSGMRRAVFQSLFCNRCGNSVFVLPQDVYPQPKKKKPAPQPDQDEVASAVQRMARTQPSRTSEPVKLRSEVVATAPSVKERQRHGSAVDGDGPRNEVLAPAPAVGVRVRRALFSPFRLIVLAIALVVAGTCYSVWNQHAREEAARLFGSYVESGTAALGHGDLREAADRFQDAVNALDRMHRDDAEAQRVRQKGKELNALVNLSTTSFYDICEQAKHAVTEGEPKWEEDFHQRFRGQWIVIEGDVVEDAGADGKVQPLIRYPFPIGEAPTFIDAQLKCLALPAPPTGPRKVIFAGQLASIKKEGKSSPAWVVRLTDHTAFLWADTDTYRALRPAAADPTSEEETRRILDQQASLLGIKP